MASAIRNKPSHTRCFVAAAPLGLFTIWVKDVRHASLVLCEKYVAQASKPMQLNHLASANDVIYHVQLNGRQARQKR
jgi:hypothetical protein